MNERIKELAKEAKEYASSFAYAQAIGQPGYQEKFSEKFAELIVRECAEAILDSETKMASYYVALMEIRLGYPQRHFGVEE